MNTKKFSEAMGELDIGYVEKAMNYQAKKKKMVGLNGERWQPACAWSLRVLLPFRNRTT